MNEGDINNMQIETMTRPTKTLTKWTTHNT